MATSSIRRLASERLPRKTKKWIKNGLRRCAAITGRYRALPDYLIIGTQKGGTSSLFYYLQQHPDVELPLVIDKEIHYFDDCSYRGETWYRSHFALQSKVVARRRLGSPALVGEATPEYLYHHMAPERVARLLPNVKLIALLRDPIERACSHFAMEIKRGTEKLSFAEALAAEPDRLAGEWDKVAADPKYRSFNICFRSYLERGRYLEQLQRWENYFPREQLLVLKSEELFTNANQVYRQVCDHLGLEPFAATAFEHINPGTKRDELEPALRYQLVEHFRPHNQALYEHLGEDFGWSP
jgi:hypothetical protein